MDTLNLVVLSMGKDVVLGMLKFKRTSRAMHFLVNWKLKQK